MLNDYDEWICDNCGQTAFWSGMVLRGDELCDECYELRT